MRNCVLVGIALPVIAGCADSYRAVSNDTHCKLKNLNEELAVIVDKKSAEKFAETLKEKGGKFDKIGERWCDLVPGSRLHTHRDTDNAVAKELLATEEQLKRISRLPDAARIVHQELQHWKYAENARAR